MKVYLVGGAVRDELLSIEVLEKDWVVVGSTEEELTEEGYKKIGRDFPVFLHPETKEEYALARKERKSGTGHKGFEFVFDPSVSLEEDLLRRDLTINAIAKDEKIKLETGKFVKVVDVIAERMIVVPLDVSDTQD